MKGVTGKIQSVRKGCFSNARLAGESSENTNSKNLFTSGGEGKYFDGISKMTFKIIKHTSPG